MQITIEEGDALVVRDVLTSWLGEASAEIRHTDNPSVRSRLRDRRDSVRRMCELLEGDRGESAAS